jgi:hypothetical protein
VPGVALWSLLACIKVEIRPEGRVVRVSVDILAPPVEELVQAVAACQSANAWLAKRQEEGSLVQVILTPAASRIHGGSSFCLFASVTGSEHVPLTTDELTYVSPRYQPLYVPIA